MPGLGAGACGVEAVGDESDSFGVAAFFGVFEQRNAVGTGLMEQAGGLMEEGPHEGEPAEKGGGEDIDARALGQEEFDNIAPPRMRRRAQRGFPVAIAPVEGGMD